jgi:hypothetical protein
MSKSENFITVPMGTVGISLMIPRLECSSDTNPIAPQEYASGEDRLGTMVIG